MTRPRPGATRGHAASPCGLLFAHQDLAGASRGPRLMTPHPRWQSPLMGRSPLGAYPGRECGRCERLARQYVVRSAKTQNAHPGRPGHRKSDNLPPVYTRHLGVHNEKADVVIWAAENAGGQVSIVRHQHVEFFLEERAGDHSDTPGDVDHGQHALPRRSAVGSDRMYTGPSVTHWGLRPLADCLTWPQAASNRHGLRLSS